MSMGENQNPAAYDSLTFGSKEVFEAEGSDDSRKGVGDVSMVSESGDIDSARKDDQNGLSDKDGDLEKDPDSLSSDMHDKGGRSLKVEELILCNGNEYEDSISRCEGAFYLFETIKNNFSDKNVLECDQPELEVMKDICVDNGMTPETKEEKDGKLFGQESLKTFSVGSSEKGTVELCDMPELAQTATKPSEENSLVGMKHPVQEAGAQVPLGSLPDSLDGEEKKPGQSTDQIEASKDCDSLLQKIPIEKAIYVGGTTSLSEAGVPKDDVQAGTLLSDSNVESGSTTFNFADTEQVQCSTTSIVDQHEQSDGSSSANSNIQHVSSEKQRLDRNSDDISSDGQVRSASDNGECLESDNTPAVNPAGETSFSAVTYSDPVSLSRSLSHRSDASTTSARSFAFPVLQSEWNSSPVRMAKADRRHFRKRKGWRSGVLCCRF